MHIWALIFIAWLTATPIADLYWSADSGMGFDKHMVLDSSQVYTGNFGFTEGTVFLEGNGAVIDLQGGMAIWIAAQAQGDAAILIQNCSIVNGAMYGMHLTGFSEAEIWNCNFVNHDIALLLSDSTMTTIRNCNFVNNQSYGLGLVYHYDDEENIILPDHDIAYCNAYDNLMNYAKCVPLPDCPFG